MHVKTSHFKRLMIGIFPSFQIGLKGLSLILSEKLINYTRIRGVYLHVAITNVASVGSQSHKKAKVLFLSETISRIRRFEQPSSEVSSEEGFGSKCRILLYRFRY